MRAVQKLITLHVVFGTSVVRSHKYLQQVERRSWPAQGSASYRPACFTQSHRPLDWLQDRGAQGSHHHVQVLHGIRARRHPHQHTAARRVPGCDHPQVRQPGCWPSLRSLGSVQQAAHAA